MCELGEADLEDFVKKYSGVIIFLLNVLDKPRAHELLSRLTDPSITYLVEEELRLHLIREVGRVSGNLDELVDLSNYLEAIDKAGSSGTLVDGADRVLALLNRMAASRSRTHFAYLDTLDEKRLRRVFAALTQRNIHVSYGVILHCSEKVLCLVLDEIAQAFPQCLSVCPESLLYLRLGREHSIYLNAKIFKHLPERARNNLTRLDTVRRRFDTMYASVAKLTGPSRRQETMQLISGILDETDPDLHSLLLSELSARGGLNDADSELLRALATARSSRTRQ
ncbi:MAG: hypothetical protein HY042_00285 [Spirochaetia bacterium]|nr:hypothetical protein [Spirochaetia bacterium]